MKRSITLFLSLGLIAIFTFFANCGDENGGDELTAQQERAKLLQGTWTVQSATVPQGVQPDILNGGTMTFNTDASYNPGSFISSGMPDFFLAGGAATWTFSGTSTEVVVLSDVSPVTGFNINSVSSSSLNITFSHPGLAGASLRVTDLGGQYTAVLTK